MNFSGKFGSDQTIWYPLTGCRYNSGSLSGVYYSGYYWSASPYSYYAYYLDFSHIGRVYPSVSCYCAYGSSVRCVRESE